MAVVVVIVAGMSDTEREREREHWRMTMNMMIIIVEVLVISLCVFFVPQEDGHTIWSVVSEISFLPIRAHKKANKAGFEAFLF